MSKNNKKIRTIFIGTPDFGIPSLKALINDNDFEIILVISSPNMRVGRHQTLMPTPIKTVALQNKLSLLQPSNIADLKGKLEHLKPDIIIVIAYSQLIPEEIINLPKYGSINLHSSLLPKYRGAAVIQAAILNGDKKTGVTVMKMDKSLDTGPILKQASLAISSNDNTGTLYEKLAWLGSNILIPTLKDYIKGRIVPQPQNESLSSYVGVLKKADGLIDWDKPADYLERFVRSMSPWPSAWTWWQGKQLKIISAQNQPIEINSYKHGKTLVYNKGLAVQCGKDALIVKKLQLEGKSPLSSLEFLNGQKNFIGSILG